MSGQVFPLRVEPLTAEAFAPFGEVIEARDGRADFTINAGNAERFHKLARIDASASGGVPYVSIVRVQPSALPMTIRMLERHLLGSQAFIPLDARRFLVVVAPAGDWPLVDRMRCFIAGRGQGVNYRSGTWHHPVIGLDAITDFLVIDRVSADIDCDVRDFAGGCVGVVDQVPGELPRV